ncbi:hypothetical protein [Streptomyces sp. G-G2]|uniref:DUF6891 domain-containing protein n=1 Tax=Streptomyces sp. G-G2 TaxID=3046201 RepID=UPI0024BA4CC9|nr:hypothetical protein [Streptomyces sp. G-G2]MDJ0382953.1 hypothetical protein [Streptomyces sp. G-G2]
MTAIRIQTERGETYRPSAPGAAARLAELAGRIGADGDHFLVVERIPSDPDFFIQVWHDADEAPETDGADEANGEDARGGYQLEYRDGGPDRHFRTYAHTAAEVGEFMAGWARRDKGWELGRDGSAAPVWEVARFAAEEEPPPLADDLREQLEERVRLSLRCGYADRAELAELAEDYLVKDGVHPVSLAQAQQLALRLWRERVAEQAGWGDGETGPDRLARAFAALEASGITARENFTCCQRCGLAEIRGDGAADARGFVFFHSQSTEGAAQGGDLYLYYGGHAPEGQGEPAPELMSSVGREVVAALDGAGLSWEWDGSAHDAISVTGLDWRKRLTN